jgi:hypothetical protein
MMMSLQYHRYYFDVHGPQTDNVDQTGTPLPNDKEALAYAMRMILELKESGLYNDPAYVVVVRSRNGDVVFSVPFRPGRNAGHRVMIPRASPGD